MSIAASRMRTAAREFWGDVQTQKQILPGVWEVTTAGHGGYMVAVPDFPLDAMLRSDQFRGASWSRGGIPVLEFFGFEEDCDWAVLMHYHPEVAEAAARKVTGSTPDDIVAMQQQYEPDRIRGVVERWNPELLKA